MDPQLFMAPPNPEGLPAPMWFLTCFKVVGFVLHIGPMNLLYAGLPLAAGMLIWGGDHAKRLSGRLGRVFPFVVAIAVNFGIVPLLFVQVSHYRLFYPTGILMAWPWFSIVVILTVSYYAIYHYAVQLKRGEVDSIGRCSISVAALGFVAIGFLFANYFSLLVNVDGWQKIWQATSVSGAVTGLGLNLADPTFAPRWLMMFGLAMTTTAAWISLDSVILAKQEPDEYRLWARRTAMRLYAAGVLVFLLMGAWYILGAMAPELRPTVATPGLALLFVLTPLSSLVGFGFMAKVTNQGTVVSAWLMVVVQYVVLVLNAVSRQITQTRELLPLNVLGTEPVATQWSTLPLFLLCFVLAVGAIVWMLRSVWVELNASASDEG